MSTTLDTGVDEPLRFDDGVLARLAEAVDHDPILDAHFRTNWLRHDGVTVRPSGVDEVCCAIAKQVILNPDRPVAVALPRGNGPLPVMLGLYLMMWRRSLGRPGRRMSGSVAVSTRRAGLRDLCRRLVFDGSALDELMPVAWLGSIPRLKRIQPAAISLDRRTVNGLSQNSSYLLFAAPNIVPPLAFNVISAMVVDTVGCSEGSWEQTYEHNVAARRRQVWVGELGDERFSEFCEQRGIVLVRLGWDLLALAAQRWGVGATKLASSDLAHRALRPPQLAFREVRHDEVEHYLREVYGALADMRKHARGQDGPEEVQFACWAANLMSRIAYPLAFYEQAASGHSYSKTVKWLVDRVDQVSASPFRGRWKDSFRSHWPVVTQGLKRLQRLLSDDEDNPKLWALGERVMDAAAGRGVTVICQTRAEAKAAHMALTDTLGMSDADLETVTVRSFSQRAAMTDEVTDRPALLLGPPPEARSDIYLSAESVNAEVLCYRHEVGRLHGRARRSAHAAAWSEHNHAALDRLGIGRGQDRPSDQSAPDRELINAGTYDADSRYEQPDTDVTIDVPDADAEFWESAVGLLGTEIEAPTTDEDPAPDTGSSRAVLITFAEGPRVYFPEDGEVTVLANDGDLTAINCRPCEVETGAHVAVLPGAERGSLLAELMAAYDTQLELVRMRYQPMYERALAKAVADFGVEFLAEVCERSPEAVRTWIDGRARPGSPDALKTLLVMSGDEQAIANQAVILAYFNKLRGAHRLIGRVLNDAVSATVLHGPESDSARALTELVGVDISDLFDNTHVLTVAAVSEPRTVPAGICGLFLDPDDLYLRAKGAL